MTYNSYPSRCPSWPHYDRVLPAAQSQYRRDKLRKKYWISIRRSSSLLPLWMEGLLLGDCFLLPLSLRHCFGVSDYCRPKHWSASKDCLTGYLVVTGFPLSFGVFQDYYSKTTEFARNRYIPVVGTVASGLGYLGAPLAMAFIQRFSRYRRQMIWIGCQLSLSYLSDFFRYITDIH